MTGTERRIRALEKEIARLKASAGKPYQSFYDIAKERCKAHWESVKNPWSGAGAFNECMEITRVAFKDKRSCCHCGLQPHEYITSMAEVDEFCSLFERFLNLYLSYQREGGCGRW